jgi:natural product precursor
MKKQNPNNKLAFNKVAVAELNDKQMHDVDGGTTSLCIVVFTTVLLALE